MKLLLTSGGITNNSIRNALVDMLGKPIAEATALFVPTAEQPLGPFFVGRSAQNLLQQEWKAFGVLELTALPSIPQEAWLPKLEAADVLLVGGGDPLYLCYWMQQSGLADLLRGASRDGLCGNERREHGAGPQHRAGVRQLEAAHRRRQRQDAGAGRFCDVSAPGQPGFAEEYAGRRRKMGRQADCAGVRD